MHLFLSYLHFLAPLKALSGCRLTSSHLGDDMLTVSDGAEERGEKGVSLRAIHPRDKQITMAWPGDRPPHAGITMKLLAS